MHGGTIEPQWILRGCLGAGGFAGSYGGPRLQSRLPERNLRGLLGVIACLVAARSSRPPPPAQALGLSWRAAISASMSARVL